MIVLIRYFILFAFFLTASTAWGSKGVSETQGDSCVSALNYDCAVLHYKRALQFHESDSTISSFVRIQNKVADLYYQQGKFQQAYELYSLVLRYAGQKGLSYDKAVALEGMSHILWRYGDNVKSITSILESIELFKALSDTVSVISASNILAGVYTSTGELDQAEKIYDETLSLAVASHDSIGMASSYEYKGVVRFFRGEYPEAIEFYEKSLTINVLIGNELDAGITQGNIGEAYHQMGNYVTALAHYQKAEKALSQFQFNSGLIFINYSIGNSYLSLGQFDKALYRYQKSLELIRLTGEVRERPLVLKLIAECYAKQQDFKKAYFYHEAFTQAQDSLLQVNRNLELLDIMGKYELGKKEQENYLLAKENEIKLKELRTQEVIIKQQYAFGAGLMLLLMIAFYLAIRLYNNRILLIKSNKTKNKLFGFVAHDLKAPVANIQMLIDLLKTEIETENEEAKDLVVELNNATHAVSLLLNDLLSWSIAQQEGFSFLPKSVEIYEATRTCIELFEDQLEYKELQVDNRVGTDHVAWIDNKALLAVIRNLLSNAIKFSKVGGEIRIYSHVKNGFVELTIADQGVGMKPEQIHQLLHSKKFVTHRGTSNEKGSGMGINLVKEFVHKSKGELRIESKMGEGTEVIIVLPTTAKHTRQ
ncbi:tetratricopeptide repeat protein [Reichenbachiella agarivorans]|uniref:histidine kinase n=1 Tax=Reichenbachiella agarivorans TaxID=2979464 RepID=A0ABY6CU37_9BACT|nr:tetratricopeptide repeat protein [Reichenbachiella agarivorans]UXP34044.1 tetratricopeptide repeat protein [Reichenbachiella agarivorans]